MQKLVMKMDETYQYGKDLKRAAATMLDGLGIIESQASAISACWYGSAGAEFGASLTRWVQATREPVSEIEILARRVDHEREEWERTVSSRHYQGVFERIVNALWDGFDPGSWFKNVFDENGNWDWDNLFKASKQVKLSLKDLLDLDYPPNKSEPVYWYDPGRGWIKMETEGGDWDAGLQGGPDKNNNGVLGLYGSAGMGKVKWTNLLFFPLPLFAITELSGPGVSAGLKMDGANAGASAGSAKLTLGANVPFLDRFVGVSFGRSAGLDFSYKWGPDNKPEITLAGWKLGLNLFSPPVDFSPPTPEEQIILPPYVEIVQ
jgi:uncharacterized protein YukE